MGGIEGSRGYFYQALASVLEALSEEDWDRIYVEFKTEKDKVDIALKLKGEKIKAIQVKSSVNLFSCSKISDWLSDLVDDSFDEKLSKEYSLHLIGSCKPKANTLIKSLKKYKAGIKNKEIMSSLNEINPDLLSEEINIKVIPFELEVLEGIIRDALNKYISKKGFTISHYGLELIAKGIEGKFMQLSTKGEYITKQDFDKNIIDNIKAISGECLVSSDKKSNHEVSFYIKPEKKFYKCINEISMLDSHAYNCLKDDYIEQIRDSKCKIDKINLPQNSSLRESFKAMESPITDLQNSMSIFPIKKKRYFLNFSYEEKKDIREDIRDILGDELTEEFFHIGNLEEIVTAPTFMNEEKRELIGNPKEKEKYEYIKDLEYLITKYQVLDIFIDEMAKYSVLPLVVRNIGRLSDSDLKIKIYIPKDVLIFQPRDYIWDKSLELMLEELVEKEGIIETIFAFRPDGNISLNNKRKTYDFRDVKASLPYTKYTLDDFYKVLGMMVEQDIYEDDKDYNIVQYSIEQLHSKENKPLISPLIIHCLKEDVKIKYQVLSANSDGTLEGFLEVKKKND